tara:strand:- start:3708 stop:4850 length:1143 start_codon:yes stop_codon:yes gene_type:complete
MEMNIQAIREEFPVSTRYIFLDHAKVAPVPRRLQESVEGFIENACEHGTADYTRWMEDVENVRDSFARLINAAVDEIAFVKNTSEGINVVANGIDWRKGDNIVVPDIEFPSNIYPWWNLKRLGVETRMVPNRKGRVLFDDIVAQTDSRTRVISVSSVECNSGFRNDLENIGNFCKDKEILFCVDAIQSLGSLPMDVKKYQIDCLSADGHKWLLGVEGCGGLYISKNVLEKIHPMVVGWDSVINAHEFMTYDFTLRPDAKRFEEGSVNVMSIKALGASLSLFHEYKMDFVSERILTLGDFILEELRRRDLKILSSTFPEERSGIISFSGQFDLSEFYHFIKSQKVLLTVRDRLIRLSPHFYNTKEEMIRFFELLDDFLKNY